MKHFNINVDNNTTNVDSNDDTYDGKIKDKIDWCLVDCEI